MNGQSPQVPMSGLFQVHRLNENGLKKAEVIAQTFNRCLFDLQGTCPEGREFSIVKTKLEEAAFFAKKAMANDNANWQPMPQPPEPVETYPVPA